MILLLESCGWCTTQADITKKWPQQNNVTFQPTSNARGGPALGCSGAGGIGATIVTPVASLVAGFRNKILTDLPSNNANLITFQESTTMHISIVVTPQGALAAYRNGPTGTQLGVTANGLITPGVFNYIEAKVTIHDTTGSVHVRLNGAEVLALTNQDTRQGLTGLIDILKFFGGNSSHAHDFYICDTNSPNGDFLGDVRVDYLAPNAAGNYSQWTPSAGSNFQNVDDADPDDDTTYNETDVANEKDSYQHAALASLVVEDIKGLVMHCLVKKSDAGSRTLRHGIRSNTTESVSGFVALATGYEYRQKTYDTDPHTAAAWTKANVDAVESLVEVGNP